MRSCTTCSAFESWARVPRKPERRFEPRMNILHLLVGQKKGKDTAPAGQMPPPTRCGLPRLQFRGQGHAPKLAYVGSALTTEVATVETRPRRLNDRFRHEVYRRLKTFHLMLLRVRKHGPQSRYGQDRVRRTASGEVSPEGLASGVRVGPRPTVAEQLRESVHPVCFLGLVFRGFLSLPGWRSPVPRCACVACCAGAGACPAALVLLRCRCCFCCPLSGVGPVGASRGPVSGPAGRPGFIWVCSSSRKTTELASPRLVSLSDTGRCRRMPSVALWIERFSHPIHLLSSYAVTPYAAGTNLIFPQGWRFLGSCAEVCCAT